MRSPIALGAATLLVLIPETSLAHTFKCPSFVFARASDGFFSYRCVFTASSNTAVAGSGWYGTTNVSGGLIGDCFCEPFCAMAAGDSLVEFVQGTLDDPEQPGEVLAYVSLCRGGGSFQGTTAIHPDERASAGDRSRAGLPFWNRPNPFIDQTTFHFAMREPGAVSLRIYDTSGRLRAVPLNEHRNAGTHSWTWTVGGAGSTPFAPGVYIARLAANGLASTRRIVITK